MDLEQLVKEVLDDETNRQSDIMFLLNCWRKQKANVYVRYTDFPLMTEPKKLLEMKDLVLQEEDRVPLIVPKAKPVEEKKSAPKATSKEKKKGKKED